jgi:hypothetical protein
MTVQEQIGGALQKSKTFSKRGSTMSFDGPSRVSLSVSSNSNNQGKRAILQSVGYQDLFVTCLQLFAS